MATVENPSAFVQEPGEAEVLWCFAELQTVLAAGARTADRLSIVEHEAPQGHCPPWHRHSGDDESFYVLDGRLTFWIDDPQRPWRSAGAGTVVFIPRRTPHSFRVDSPTARWLTVSTPAGHERFYAACGERAAVRTLPPAGAPDMAKVQAAAAAHGVELLGPPPAAA